MTKKQKHLTAAEVKETMSEKVEEEIDQKVAAEIQAILTANKRGLFAYIERTSQADIARVRLTRLNTENSQGNSN